MKKNVSITKAVQFVINAEKERYTMLGIGPMSENFLRASLEISKEKDFPLMYIASRNQVILINLAVDMYSTVTRNYSERK